MDSSRSLTTSPLSINQGSLTERQHLSWMISIVRLWMKLELTVWDWWIHSELTMRSCCRWLELRMGMFTREWWKLSERTQSTRDTLWKALMSTWDLSSWRTQMPNFDINDSNHFKSSCSLQYGLCPHVSPVLRPILCACPQVEHLRQTVNVDPFFEISRFI